MGGSNGPWRGPFGSGFEGDMRAPAMVRWPGRVASRRRGVLGPVAQRLGALQQSMARDPNIAPGEELTGYP